MIAKLVHGNEIHLYKGEMTLRNIRSHCFNVFKSLNSATVSLQFSYIDEQGDKINVNCQDDFEVLKLSQNSTSIHRLYIETIENDFEVLNPEQFDHLQKSQTEKIIEIIPKQFRKNQTKKLSIFGREALIQKEAKKFYEELAFNAAKKVQQQEEKLIKDQVGCYMEYLIDDCSSKIIIEQEKSKRLEKCLKDLEKSSQKKSVGVQRMETIKIPTKLCSNENIDRMVEDKLSKIIPQIVKRTTRAVEAKLKIQGCLCCKKEKKEKMTKSKSLGK